MIGGSHRVVRHFTHRLHAEESSLAEAEDEGGCAPFQGTPLDGPHCPQIFDSILCWPPTLPNSLATVHCMEEFGDIKYDVTSKSIELVWYWYPSDSYIDLATK